MLEHRDGLWSLSPVWKVAQLLEEERPSSVRSWGFHEIYVFQHRCTTRISYMHWWLICTFMVITSITFHIFIIHTHLCYDILSLRFSCTHIHNISQHFTTMVIEWNISWRFLPFYPLVIQQVLMQAIWWIDKHDDLPKLFCSYAP